MTEEMIAMLVDITSELGRHIAQLCERVTITSPSVRDSLVLAITDDKNPGVYEIVIAMSRVLDVEGQKALLGKVGPEDFKNFVLTDNPLNFGLVAAVVGPITEEELWKAVQSGMVSASMKEQPVW